MKHFILTTLAISALSTGTVSFAATKVFSGTSTYTKPGLNSSFAELEQLGVERDAEKRAYSACVASGATDCVILSDAEVTKCNYGYDLYSTGCTAEAHARGTVNQ